MSAQLVSENVRLGGRHAIGLLCQGRGGCAPHRRAVGQGILFGGLPVDAQFPGDCPKGQAPEFSLLNGFPYGPLTRGGLSVQFRSGFACPPGPVDISCFQSCQALLPAAVDCPAPLALVASLRTGGNCPEQTRSRRCLLGGDDPPQILHGYQAFQVLVYFHLQSGVAGAIRTRQQLEPGNNWSVRVLYLTVLSLATLRECLKQRTCSKDRDGSRGR